VTDITLPPVLQRLASMWDEVVENFSDGNPPWSEELRPWVDAYRGTTPATRRVDDAMPEPFNGRLDRKPKAILLALNPGNAFMGRESWMGHQLMPDLQSRKGLFSQQIRECDGSYTKWARQPFDWPALNGGSPHPFVTSRMRFVNDWTEEIVEPDEVVWFDLYPWHSKSWSSIDVRGTEVRNLIDKYVAQPIAALASDWTFAFGKPWFDVLPVIGFDKVVQIGGNGMDLWDSQTPSRVVGVFESRTSGCRVIAMRHSGSAGPPKQSEVASLRKLLESTLENRD